MAHVDFEDDTSLNDLGALHSAEDARELHRRLLCLGYGGGSKADAFEPWCLFRKVQSDEPEGAVATALLLLTDRRWRNATGRLVRRIEESGLIPEDELDLLARTFLTAGAEVYWEAPGDWFDGPAIVLDLDDDGGDEVLEGEGADEPDDGPVVFAREIRPPLRRWAAARAIRSDPSCWGALVNQARQADPRGGAAMVHGLVDSVDVLTPAARDLVLGLAESWPHRKLREAASAVRHPPEPSPSPTPLTPATGVQERPAAEPTQPSLF